MAHKSCFWTFFIAWIVLACLSAEVIYFQACCIRFILIYQIYFYYYHTSTSYILSIHFFNFLSSVFSYHPSYPFLSLFTCSIFIFIPDTCRDNIKMSASRQTKKTPNFFFFFLISPLYSHLPFHIRRFSSGTACGRVLTWILANQRPWKVQVQWRTVISVSRSGYLICRLQDYPIVKIWNTSCMAVLIRFSLCFAMKMLIIW